MTKVQLLMLALRVPAATLSRQQVVARCDFPECPNSASLAARPSRPDVRVPHDAHGLALGLGLNKGLGSAITVPTAIALAAAFVGMTLGQAPRSRLSVTAFRRGVLVGLLALGGSMLARFVL